MPQGREFDERVVAPAIFRLTLSVEIIFRQKHRVAAGEGRFQDFQGPHLSKRHYKRMRQRRVLK